MTSLPMALAKGWRASLRPSKAPTGNACSPSHSASLGSWCDSTIRPSASAATAALERGTTRSRRPAACEGSTITGRSVNLLVTMTSVTTLRPRGLATSDIILSPSSPRPWKEYGDVRGLKAPPRTYSKPACLTALAEDSNCSWLSTVQGPATTRKEPGRIMPLLVETYVLTPRVLFSEMLMLAKLSALNF